LPLHLTAMTHTHPILELSGVDAAYRRASRVLHGVSLQVGIGAVVALLGANGAGKSTVLKCISNLLQAEQGVVTAGSVQVDGVRVDGNDPAELVRRGVAHVMEGRRLFPHLTVHENLRTGAFQRSDRVAVKQDLEKVYDYFPAIRSKRSTQAGYLSGGEQQMVALARALVARPRLLLLDEPSMGLAPIVAKEIFQIIRRLRESEGLSILLAEQNAAATLALVDYGYVLENGRVVREGSANELRRNDDIRRFYLGFDQVAEHSAEQAFVG
jgi:branched-chain amino acid transport system ATP-binding protein